MRERSMRSMTMAFTLIILSLITLERVGASRLETVFAYTIIIELGFLVYHWEGS